jgi:hypothetical protein
MLYSVGVKRGLKLITNYRDGTTWIIDKLRRDRRMTRIMENGKTRGGRLRIFVALAFVVLTVVGLNACAEDNDDNVSKPAAAATPSSAIPTGAKVIIKTSTASNSGTADAAPTNATDGDIKTQWSSGGPAPQWIQLDLGEASSISKLRFNVSQTPTGPTTHQIFGGATPDQLKLLGTLDTVTADSQWFELSVPSDNVRYLKIVTIKSPSWIAWREIEVYK